MLYNEKTFREIYKTIQGFAKRSKHIKLANGYPYYHSIHLEAAKDTKVRREMFEYLHSVLKVDEDCEPYDDILCLCSHGINDEVGEDEELIEVSVFLVAGRYYLGSH